MVVDLTTHVLEYLMNVCVINVLTNIPIIDIKMTNIEAGSFHFKYIKGNFSQPFCLLKNDINKIKNNSRRYLKFSSI